MPLLRRALPPAPRPRPGGRRLPRVPGPPSPALPVARAFRRRASCGLPRASCRATLLAAPVAGPLPAPGVPVRGRGGRSARATPAARPPGALRPVGRWRPPVRASAAVGRGRAAGGGLRPPPLWRLFAARPLARSRGFGLFPFFRESLTAVPGERSWVPKLSYSPGSTGSTPHQPPTYPWLFILVRPGISLSCPNAAPSAGAHSPPGVPSVGMGEEAPLLVVMRTGCRWVLSCPWGRRAPASPSRGKKC